MDYNFESLTKAIVLNEEVEKKAISLLDSDPIFDNPEKYFSLVKNSETDFIKQCYGIHDSLCLVMYHNKAKPPTAFYITPP